MPRFVTCCGGDRNALKLAWLFLCLLPGAPCIYYGDEVGLDGRHDPDCRKGFPWNQQAWDLDLKNWFQQCIQLRKAQSAPRNGPKSIVVQGSSTIAWLCDGDRPCIAAFNAGSDRQRLTVDASHGTNSTLLMSTTADVEVYGEGDGIEFTLPPRSAAVVV